MMDAAVTILVGDAKETLKTLESGSVQACVTSPPYFGLRDYGVDGQIGLEPTPDAYVASLVDVFRELRRVLADDGVFWLNIGDSYAGNKSGNTNGTGSSGLMRDGRAEVFRLNSLALQGANMGSMSFRKEVPIGMKPKDLLMIPARVALALQADGWYLRSHCIWHKPCPMPESVKDRPTSAHESVFLFAKNSRYFYDAEAVREPAVMTPQRRSAVAGYGRKAVPGRKDNNGSMLLRDNPTREYATRNMRNVWVITPRNFRGAHFATFPPELASRCIKAGSRPGDTVIDPFFGAGTVGLVGSQLGRSVIGIELNAEYAALAEQRIADDTARRSQPQNQPRKRTASKPATHSGLFDALEAAE